MRRHFNLKKRDQIEVEITNLTIYPSFKEIYTKIPAKDVDSVGETVDNMLTSTYNIYSKEKEEQYGTLAIELKLTLK